jgi:phosphate transport system permease protein
MLHVRNAFLKRRYRKARVFQTISMASVLFCIAVLVVFLASIAKSAIIPLRSVEALYSKNIEGFIQQKLTNKNINLYFPKSIKYQIKGEQNVWTPVKYEFKKYFLTGKILNPEIESDYKLLKNYLLEHHIIKTRFNTYFFTHGNSIYPEIAGIKSATVGSFFVLIIFVVCTIPIGILVGIYISEFLPQGKKKAMLQINIQNLASIPSIIYGIIVLNIFINGLNFTRSSALVGGIALSLLILPMIIMITYNAASMVPQGYKDSSLALGLSDVQTVFITTLPLAIPRIITGVLLAIARAAGETAPLIIVGMAFFSSSVPSSIVNSATTTLPLQIFLWTSDPQEAFIEHASAAILVFIIFLTTINFCVHCIRNRLNRV